MKTSPLRRGFAALTAIAVITGNYLLLQNGKDAGFINAVKELHLPLNIVQWELGDLFDATSGIPPAAVLALRQSPVLYAARYDIAETATQSPTISTLPQSPATPIPAPSSGDLTFTDNGVPSQTTKPTGIGGYTVVNGVYIKNASNKILSEDALAQPLTELPADGAPLVLIMHTHGSEAYTPAEPADFVSEGTYRSSDPAYSVIGVGDAMAATLSEYGISVVHDRTLYDDPLYDGSYERSAQGVTSYLEKYPTIAYVLDVHRDAVQDSSGKQYKLISQEDVHAAQISFVMGSNHEGWEDNLRLAVAVSAAAATDRPTLMRPITLRNSNYNQHLCPGAMLVEVGTAGNSPDEAVYSGRIFATALARVITGQP